MKRTSHFSLLLILTLSLAGCAVFKKKSAVKECEEKAYLTGEISNVLMETKATENVRIYGTITENKKPVASGIIYFTNEATNVTVNEFIMDGFSVSLLPGIYKVKIDTELFANYDLGTLEFKSGEVRKIDFTLDGRVLFIERTTYPTKKRNIK